MSSSSLSRRVRGLAAKAAAYACAGAGVVLAAPTIPVPAPVQVLIETLVVNPPAPVEVARLEPKP